jgi:methionine sulfoxide reductase heme-binding subunit
MTAPSLEREVAVERGQGARHSRPDRKRRLELGVHLGALIPLVWFATDLVLDRVSPDLIREVTLRTGLSALIFLLLTLAVTPIVTLTGWSALNPLRRWFGIYAFAYAALHLFIFVAIDYGFNARLLAGAVLKKPYALAGLAALMIMLPLVATSTDAMQRRLRRNWKRLHRAAYLAGALAIVHYVWLVKVGVIDPWWYAALLGLLFALRLGPVRRWVSQLRRR